MKIDKKKLLKIGLILGLVGVAIFLIVVISGASYPDIFFRVLSPIGLASLLIGVIIICISWILMIREAAKENDKSRVRKLILGGLIVLLIPIIKILIFS